MECIDHVNAGNNSFVHFGRDDPAGRLYNQSNFRLTLQSLLFYLSPFSRRQV